MASVSTDDGVPAEAAGPGTLQSLKYSRGTLEVLDQLVIPHETSYVPVTCVEEAWSVIKQMQVRGAPLIAIVAALGLAVEVFQKCDGSTAEEAVATLKKKMQYLRTSRPTAVNLFTATDHLAQVVTAAAAAEGATRESVVTAYIEEAEAMLEADVSANKAIGSFGAEAMIATAPGNPAQLKVLTICNTGSLATAGYGTALGVVRALAERRALEEVFACETRPYNQGSRLTAFELVEEQLPGTLICDSSAATLMATKGIHGVVVGADRVTKNGDTANKIGTYQLAIAAKHHEVPFYVASPSTTCDTTLNSGAEIAIEERAAEEVRAVRGVQIAPKTVNVWNPVFDVTPSSLISGIITEFGVISPDASGAYDVEAFLCEHAALTEPGAKRRKVN